MWGKRVGFLLLAWCALARAVEIAGHIRWNAVCQNTTALGHARALLDEGKLYGSITSNGKFVIPDVPDGTYVFSVDSHDYAFDQYRIDVNHRSISPVEVRPYILGVPMGPPSNILLPYPLSIASREKYVYFLPQESFNLGGMLLNPMMLAMIACGGLVLAMPYIMKNLDTDALQGFSKEQARLGRARNTESSTSTSSSAVDEKAALAPQINKAASNSKSKAGSKKRKHQ